MAASSCRSAGARSAAYQAKVESARVRGADRDDLSQRRAAAPAPARAPRWRRRSRSVRYRSTRQRLQQAGAGGGVVADVPQRGLVEGDGLPVRPGAGRLGRRGGGVPQDPGDVAGRRRVVGEHARVARRPTRARRSSPRAAPARRRAAPRPSTADRAISCRKATPRPCRSSRPVAASTSTVAGGTPSAASSSPPTRFRGARQQLQAPPGRRGQPGGPGEHGVAHALGQRRVRLGEDLADEERVARGAAVHVGRVEPVSVEQCGDRGPAQRGQLQPARVGLTHEVAEDGAQRVVGAERVAVGQHQQQRQRRDPAGEEPDEVERRLVAPSAGPRRRTRAGGRAARRAPRRRSRAGRRVPRSRPATSGPSSCATSRSGPSGRGRAQRVAHAPQRLRTGPRPLDEGTQEDGLADARLAGDEHDRSVAGGRARRARSSSTSRGCSRSSSRTPRTVGEGDGREHRPAVVRPAPSARRPRRRGGARPLPPHRASGLRAFRGPPRRGGRRSWGR